MALVNTPQPEPGLVVLYRRVILSPAACAANTSAEQTFTVPTPNGAAAGLVLINKPTAQAGLIVGEGRISAANQVGITFGNFTGAPITPTAAQIYEFFFIVVRAD